jgi:hypothetical protein
MTDIPTNEPLSARAGDTWKWTRSLDDYPATLWTLKYRFKHPTAAGFEITATASGADHSVTVTAATSAALAAGLYTWIGWVQDIATGLEKYTVDTGSLTIDPDYRTGTSAAPVLDDRSHARKMLEAIEAWLESRDLAVAEYEIAGRRMKYIPIAELIKMRSRYQLEVNAQANADLIAKGEGIGRKIQFRI